MLQKIVFLASEPDDAARTVATGFTDGQRLIRAATFSRSGKTVCVFIPWDEGQVSDCGACTHGWRPFTPYGPVTSARPTSGIRKMPECAALEHFDGKIESERTKLTFIVAMGRKILHTVLMARVLQDMSHRAVDEAIASAAAFVGRPAAVTHARDYKSVIDPKDPVFVA